MAGIRHPLEAIADAAVLPAQAHVAKAKRSTAGLLATIACFSATLQQKVEALDRAPAIAQAVLDRLIPALYIGRVAERSTRAEESWCHSAHDGVVAVMIKATRPGALESPIRETPFCNRSRCRGERWAVAWCPQDRDAGQGR